jgi:hypothetical protein
VSATVANAYSCVFSSTDTAVTGLPATVACQTNVASTNITVPANTTTSAETIPITLSATGPAGTISQTIDLTVAAQPVSIIHVSGTLPGDETWGPSYAHLYVIDGTVIVPAGITLTVQPGTIVKVESGAMIDVQGNLDAVGTTADPITFTSINDNSIGGITGSGSPAVGDWGGIEVSSAGSVDLSSAQVLYASPDLSGSTSGSVSVIDAQFLGGGLSVGAGTGTVVDSDFTDGGLSVDAQTVTVQNSSVTDPGGIAFEVTSPALNFDQLTGNSATGSGVLGFFVAGTVSTSATLVAQAFPWLLGNSQCNGELTIPSGVTVNVEPGVVFKGINGDPMANCGTPYNASPGIVVQGNLDAVGTTADPITFTSINDNSIGGITGSGSPAVGDWGGIEVSSAGSVDLSSAQVLYASPDLSGSTSGSVSVIDAQFLGGGLSVGAGTGTVVDSDFTDGGLSVDAQTVTVQNSSVTDPGGIAFEVTSPALNFDQLTGNSATGSGVLGFFVAGTVSTSATLVAQAFPWLLGNSQCNGELTIPSGVTVNVEPGVVFKGINGDPMANCGTPYNASPGIVVQGNLDAVGTTADPITFTSINDNSIGGITGSGSPAVGDWGGIEVEGGSIDLEYANVSYASTAVYASTSNLVKVENDIFRTNSVALQIQGQLGTNAAVHDNWFDQNVVALSGDSIWEPIAPCGYFPDFYASANTFGALQSPDPVVSETQYLELLFTESWPDDVGDLQQGTTDQIQLNGEGCSEVDEDGNPIVVPYLATPYLLHDVVSLLP